MKIRYTEKNNLKTIASKLVLIVACLTIALIAPVNMMQNASAETIDEINARYNAKKTAIQQTLDGYTAQLSQLANQANTLHSAIDTLTIQKSEIQAQIDLSQANYDKLIAQISDTEQQIKNNQDALGKTIANMYVDDRITPLEMLASSKSIGDYLDKQEYRSSVRNKLTSTITKIKDLKNALDKQKIEVGNVLTQQNSQKSILVAKEAEQQNLLNETQGQESAYQQLTAQKSAELSAANDQQRIEVAKLTGNGTNTSGSVGSFSYRNYSGNQGACGGGYPSNALGIYSSPWGCSFDLDEGVDSWALYNRECVSYTAWAAYTRFHKKVTSFMGLGFAWQWPSTALSMGANVDNTPEIGSVAITPIQRFTPQGHAMIVEQVYGDGWIRVSQYNFAGTGEYSTMDLLASSAVYVHFQNR